MINTLYWVIIIAISAIVAFVNFYKSVMIEKDIRNGIDAKIATKYHRKWFFKKKVKLAYDGEVERCRKSK